ncbi:DUF6541 family protein [Amycolatopsis rubida]|uniref:DUF6541 family protein n=1 Tax=Amycolatopsis TaxID=1813 RepID=UPI0012FF6887|nr:DUF6541 family protein [Amycolatopsis rubida]MYW91712.1 hypothetical protein [Amycolatopsis rubida]
MTVCVAAAILWLPGLAVISFLGQRGWVAAACAPAVTLSMTGLAGLAATATGMRWGFEPFLLLVGLVGALCLAGRRSWRRRVPQAGRHALPDREPDASPPGLLRVRRWSIPLGIGIAGTIAAVTTLGGMGNPHSVPQLWDAIFHGNAIRFISETGDANPVSLAQIGDPAQGSSFYYPNAFHLMGALVQHATGQSIPTVLNAFVVVVAVVIVPVSVAGFLSGVGAPVGWTAASVAVSTAFTNMPYALWKYGGLYPYTLALCLIWPAAALAIRWITNGGAPTLAAAALSLHGTFVTQPSVILIAVPCLVFAVVRLGKRTPATAGAGLFRAAVLAAVSAALALPTLIGLLRMLPTVSAYDWPAKETLVRSLGKLAVLGGEGTRPQWVLAAFSWAGIVLLWRDRERRWLLWIGLMFGILYVLTASSDARWLKPITAPWWNDAFRFVVIVTFVAIAAAGLAFAAAQSALSRLCARWGRLARHDRATITAAACIEVALVTVASVYLGPNQARLKPAYHGTTVTPETEDAMRWLAAHAKPGEEVMNDNSDGTVWTYGLSGVRTFIPYFGSYTAGSDRQLLLSAMDEIDTNPQVKETAERNNIRYVFVSDGLLPGRKRASGLDALDQSPAFAAVFGNRSCRIYRMRR